MRRRLYYVMPDLECARKIMNDLLLARIEERHIHCLARPGTSMEGLHEANVLQKTDLVHGAQTGLLLGALLGCIVGGAGAARPDVPGQGRGAGTATGWLVLPLDRGSGGCGEPAVGPGFAPWSAW